MAKKSLTKFLLPLALIHLLSQGRHLFDCLGQLGMVEMLDGSVLDQLVEKERILDTTLDWSRDCRGVVDDGSSVVLHLLDHSFEGTVQTNV